MVLHFQISEFLYILVTWLDIFVFYLWRIPGMWFEGSWEGAGRRIELNVLSVFFVLGTPSDVVLGRGHKIRFNKRALRPHGHYNALLLQKNKCASFAP